MEMENSQSMVNENLAFFMILREALRIPNKNPNFIIFTLFLTSLPLVCIMVPLEMLCQQILIETLPSLTYTSYYGYWYNNYYYFGGEISDLTQLSMRFLQLAILYLVPLPFLDFLNALVTVNLASAIYAEEKVMSLKEMLHGLINNIRFKGPLITSFYVFFMSISILVGFFWLATSCFVMDLPTYFLLIFGVGFVLLLAKLLDWSAVWNVGIVISMLEEIYGVEALGISRYICRNSRRLGLKLMLIFFIWRFGLRLSCLYLGWQEKETGVLVTLAHVILGCLGNWMKWVVCLVYFFQCKKWVLEKKVDVEEGGKLDVVNLPLT